MAEYITNVMAQTSKLDWAFPFERKGQFPIDRSTLFSSLEDAQKYALGDGSDERKLGGTSYVGQLIAVYEANDDNATVNAYIITPARGLMKLAATTASGDVAADIVDLQGKVDSVLNEIGTPGTEEAEATGIYKTIEDESARAQEAEKELAELIAELEQKEDKDTVYGVEDGDLILALDTNNNFNTTLKIVHQDNKIKLLGINDAEISSFDASEFVVDGMLTDAEYDAQDKELIFTWNIETGTDVEGNPIYKTDRVQVGDLVDTYTAGLGIAIVDNEIEVSIAQGEKFLVADQTGLHTTGIPEAIAAALAEAKQYADDNDNNTTYTLANNGVTLTFTPSEGNATTLTLDAYTKSETDSKIDEKIASVTGGESAADVKLALESYRDALNKEVWGDDAGSWTTTTDADGKTTVVYTPQYGATSRIDALETATSTTLPEAIAQSLADAKQYTDDAIAELVFPVAAEQDTLGLIKGTNNKVTVAAGEITGISTDILLQGEAELILNGGSAN